MHKNICKSFENIKISFYVTSLGSHGPPCFPSWQVTGTPIIARKAIMDKIHKILQHAKLLKVTQ